VQLDTESDRTLWHFTIEMCMFVYGLPLVNHISHGWGSGTYRDMGTSFISSNYLLQRHLSMIFLILKVATNGTTT